MTGFGRGKYDQFFDVDEKYFPCIDDSAIAGGARWETTYPHATFRFYDQRKICWEEAQIVPFGFMVHTEPENHSAPLH